LTQLADLMARHNYQIKDVAYITGVSEKTIERWLDDETSKRKPCPSSAYRLLLLMAGEASLEDFRP
jgi:hypothetical protein